MKNTKYKTAFLVAKAISKLSRMIMKRSIITEKDISWQSKTFHKQVLREMPTFQICKPYPRDENKSIVYFPLPAPSSFSRNCILS